MLYTTINRQRVVSLWPVRLPASDGRVNEWHRSAQEAAERAVDRWIRTTANMNLGAYEIIDRLAERGPRPAPITVYRALDFLLAQGLVHRIESRNAYIACIGRHEPGAMMVFLLCDLCGAVGEAPSAAVAKSLVAAARSAGFTPKTPVIEIPGICAHCGGR